MEKPPLQGWAACEEECVAVRSSTDSHSPLQGLSCWLGCLYWKKELGPRCGSEPSRDPASPLSPQLLVDVTVTCGMLLKEKHLEGWWASQLSLRKQSSVAPLGIIMEEDGFLTDDPR